MKLFTIASGVILFLASRIANIFPAHFHYECIVINGYYYPSNATLVYNPLCYLNSILPSVNFTFRQSAFDGYGYTHGICYTMKQTQ